MKRWTIKQTYLKKKNSTTCVLYSLFCNFWHHFQMETAWNTCTVSSSQVIFHRFRRGCHLNNCFHETARFYLRVRTSESIDWMEKLYVFCNATSQLTIFNCSEIIDWNKVMWFPNEMKVIFKLSISYSNSIQYKWHPIHFDCYEL